LKKASVRVRPLLPNDYDNQTVEKISLTAPRRLALVTACKAADGDKQTRYIHEVLQPFSAEKPHKTCAKAFWEILRTSVRPELVEGHLR
jgi:hypothetical protein